MKKTEKQETVVRIDVSQTEVRQILDKAAREDPGWNLNGLSLVEVVSDGFGGYKLSYIATGKKD